MTQPVFSRRRLLGAAFGMCAAGLGLPGPARGTTGLSLVDIAGREVRLARPPRRIALGDGPLAYVAALLRPQAPFDDIVAWGDNFRAADLGGYRAYQARFPMMDGIPLLRGAGAGAIDAEHLLDLAPDVLLLNLSSLAGARASGLIAHLAQAGIAVVFVDFRQHIMANTARSVQIMGEVFSAQARAQDFLAFRDQALAQVADRLSGAVRRPRVVIERAAGLYQDCCLTYGTGNFGELVGLAGGENLAAGLLPGTFGTLHPEQVIAADPEVVIVTGADWSLYAPAGDWVGLGPGTDPARARDRLAQLMRRPAYRRLDAVREGRVHAIWHPFYDNPYSFVAVQRLARWLHPQALADVDPEQTLRELHERFLPIPYQPAYWVSLEAVV